MNYSDLPIEIQNIIYDLHPYWVEAFDLVIEEINENNNEELVSELYMHLMMMEEVIEDLVSPNNKKYILNSLLETFGHTLTLI